VGDDQSAEQLGGALDAIRRGVSDAAQIVRAMPDPPAAFKAATQLGDCLRDATSDTGQLRAEMAARIWRDEELSLGALAQRIGVSKARADQLIRAAKAGTQEGARDG
jgi:hypothetical protein